LRGRNVCRNGMLFGLRAAVWWEPGAILGKI
jgi:hypothetical protein